MSQFTLFPLRKSIMRAFHQKEKGRFNTLHGFHNVVHPPSSELDARENFSDSRVKIYPSIGASRTFGLSFRLSTGRSIKTRGSLKPGIVATAFSSASIASLMSPLIMSTRPSLYHESASSGSVFSEETNCRFCITYRIINRDRKYLYPFDSIQLHDLIPRLIYRYKVEEDERKCF
jgi:hypothetical protein